MLGSRSGRGCGKGSIGKPAQIVLKSAIVLRGQTAIFEAFRFAIHAK